MSAQSHYEIVVSHRWQHLFATAPRSCTTKAETNRVLGALTKRFPQAEGFTITCTFWECVGHPTTVLDEGA
jgi:hypothetical protein